MLKFAVANRIDNLNNLNIALIDKSTNISENSVIQIDDLSISESENRTPIFTDHTITKSDSDGLISNSGNQFKTGAMLSNRYIFNPVSKLTVPLWYKYIPPNALHTKSVSNAINKFNNITLNKQYKLSYADDSTVSKNKYIVQKRRYDYQKWSSLKSSAYTINKAENTITITDTVYSGYNIKIINKTISDPIKVYYEDSSDVENYTIELIETINTPVSIFTETSTAMSENFHIKLLLHEIPEDTLYISYQGYSEYLTFIVNPEHILKEDIDFSIQSNYDIETSLPDTKFYIKYPERNSILNINKINTPQKSVWNITIPDTSTTINGYSYTPKEADTINRDKIITVKEPITRTDEKIIKLSRDNIYVRRGIDNKPLNVTLYSELENGEIVNHNNVIDDIDESNKTIYLDRIEPINTIRTTIEYQVKLDNVPIYSYNLNPHKMFNKYAATSNIIVYMIPESEASTNRTVFFFPVYNNYEFIESTNKYHMSMMLGIDYIETGNVYEEISNYVNTTDIHPFILGTLAYIAPISPNDMDYIDVRRLGTDIAYDEILNPYYDSKHNNYTTVGYWWGKPLNLDNIAIVYIKQTTIDRLKVIYQQYDLYTQRQIENNDSFNLDKHIISNVVKPKIKSRLRVGCKLLLKVVE